MLAYINEVVDCIFITKYGNIPIRKRDKGVGYGYCTSITRRIKY